MSTRHAEACATSRPTIPKALRAAAFLHTAANGLRSTSRANLVYGVQLSDVLSHF